MTRLTAQLGFLLTLLAFCSCGGQETTAPAAPVTKQVTIAQPAPPPGNSRAAAPPTPASWETYHGTAALDGSSNIVLPESLTLVWRTDVGAPVSNPPVVGKDRICVTDKKGDVHAMDLTGHSVWAKSFLIPGKQGNPPNPVDFDAPLALFDSTLIACTAAGRVYALDVANGDLRWERNLDFPILGTPNVASVLVDGASQKRLFVIDQSEGSLQCMDFASGKPLWKGKAVARCDGSTAVSSTLAVYGSCAGAIHVFSPVTGELLRQIPLDEDSQVAGGVVLLGDSVYSGSRSGKFVRANAQTGTIDWTNTDCEGEAFSTPAVNADRVIFTANDGVVYALDRQTGTLKWKHKLEDTASSPVIAGDKIVTTAGGSLYLLRAADGTKLWSYAVSDDVTSPSLAGSLVLVGAEDGSVTAFGQKVGE